MYSVERQRSSLAVFPVSLKERFLKMTGNTSKWRAPLAGLASIAMLATMGVAASTANAAPWYPSSDASTQYQALVYRADKPWDNTHALDVHGSYGELVHLSESSDPYASDSSKVLSYFSTDLAGKHKVPSDYVLTGDVKLFAQYKDAVTVSFDTNGDRQITSSDKSFKIAKGDSLTAEVYNKELDTNSDGVADEPTSVVTSLTDPTFVGWTSTYSKNDAADDLYEGGKITENTTFYPHFASAQNVATIAFREFGQDSTSYTYRNTLTNHAFPAYRLPVYTGDKALGTTTSPTPSARRRTSAPPTTRQRTSTSWPPSPRRTLPPRT
ncbi:hypothetical protein BCAL_2262 [Bifidobacterium callitrichos DSM 23973]|uniref:Uncharacterized protein n=2 Tax=Bifidobacterium callitrichos TaxID=762209 RepID=A0A086ZWS6_9BIFI|nr:hypothetical protein BCAL_2262 [Bifidobacterium callitrichos DSM 23973]